jgi:hypothetical protein
MQFTSSIVTKQALVEQKRAPSFSHQISLSIGSCVLSKSSDTEGDLNSCKGSPSRSGAWFDHIWSAADTSGNETKKPESDPKELAERSAEALEGKERTA